MAGEDSTAVVQQIESLLRLVRNVARISATGFKGVFKKHCTDLSRRVALLSNLFEEIRDSQGDRRRLCMACSSSSFSPCLSQLTAALKAVIMLLQSAGGFDHINSPERGAVEFTSKFRSVTCKLEHALANLPYDDFDISEDTKEQVDLARRQCIRARQRYETTDIHHHEYDHGVESIVRDEKTSDQVEIPAEFMCPITRDLIRDPVIVSTGQTYERLDIQMWINSGKKTCPKTRLKLRNFTLIPNYALRNLVAEWCKHHNISIH